MLNTYKLFLFISLFIPLHAMDADLLKSWAPVQDYANLNEAILSERPVAFHTDQGMYFGKSWPGLNPLQLECLNDIRKNFERSKSRVPMMDIGAGHGTMTWKAIIAGSYVTAVEMNKAAAEELKRNVAYRSAPFITPQERKNLPAEVCIKDFLQISDRHKDKYDIAWSGQNIHFFTPTQISAYLKKLYDILKPGGRAYLLALTPSGDPDMMKYYFQARDRREDFPGYFAFNSFHFNDGRVQQGAVNDSIVASWEFLPANKNLAPGKIFKGFMGSPMISPSLQNRLVRYIENQSDNFLIGEYRKYISITHSFDDETFRRIFTNAGFEIEKLFYIDDEDQWTVAQSYELTDEMRSQKKWSIAIKVKKPIKPLKVKKCHCCQLVSWLGFRSY